MKALENFAQIFLLSHSRALNINWKSPGIQALNTAHPTILHFDFLSQLDTRYCKIHRAKKHNHKQRNSCQNTNSTTMQV